jgi:hypothetical protein
MTNAGCPDDDLATLRHCSGSLTVMPPAGPFRPVCLTRCMAVSNPRSRFGFGLVEQPLYSGASKHPLSSNSAPASIACLFSKEGRAGSNTSSAKESVGGDTWQLMPDWTQCPTSSNPVVPDSALFNWHCPLARPIYCHSTMTNRTVRHDP